MIIKTVRMPSLMVFVFLKIPMIGQFPAYNKPMTHLCFSTVRMYLNSQYDLKIKVGTYFTCTIMQVL